MSDYDGARTRRAYCPYCGETRTVRVTVPWQEDTCTECGNNVPTDGDKS